MLRPCVSLGVRWTYRSFFAAPPDVIARGRAAARSPRDPSRPWRPAAETANWEGQQPPLYYAVLAPPSRFQKAGACKGRVIFAALDLLIHRVARPVCRRFLARHGNSTRLKDMEHYCSCDSALACLFRCGSSKWGV